MKGNSRASVVILFDGLEYPFNQPYEPVRNLRRGILSALQKSFKEPIVSWPEDILVVFSGRSLFAAETPDFNLFLRITILLLKEGEYLNWDLLAQLNKEALAAVVLKWLQTIGVKSKTMVLLQWQQADRISFLSTESESEQAHFYVDPSFLTTAGSIL